MSIRSEVRASSKLSLRVTPYFNPQTKGGGAVLPQYVSQPYTLTITQ